MVRWLDCSIVRWNNFGAARPCGRVKVSCFGAFVARKPAGVTSQLNKQEMKQKKLNKKLYFSASLKKQPQMKAISLYSGAGGLDQGLIRAGFEVIFANDFDKNACETYKENLGDHIQHGDKCKRGNKGVDTRTSQKIKLEIKSTNRSTAP